MKHYGNGETKRKSMKERIGWRKTYIRQQTHQSDKELSSWNKLIERSNTTKNLSGTKIKRKRKVRRKAHEHIIASKTHRKRIRLYTKITIGYHDWFANNWSKSNGEKRGKKKNRKRKVSGGEGVNKKTNKRWSQRYVQSKAREKWVWKFIDKKQMRCNGKNARVRR